MLAPVTMHKTEKCAANKRYVTKYLSTFFLQNMGCSRKVYNLFVDDLYKQLESAGYEKGDLPDIKIPEVTKFKSNPEYKYLKDADSLALANAKIDFTAAVNRYYEDFDHESYTARAKRRDESGTEKLSFRGLNGMPKFHSKARGYFSYRTNCQYPSPSNSLKRPTIRLEGNKLYLPKCKEAIIITIHRPLPKDAKIGNVTVTMDIDGAFFVSIEYSYTIMMETSLREAAIADDSSILNKLKFIGLDYSQSNFYVDSKGGKANYPYYYRNSEDKLARLQRQLSRMEKGSHNYDKKLMDIKRLHKKTRDQRNDFANKQASSLAKEYDVVVVEDLNLHAMAQALSIGKNLHDNGFGMFRTKLARKLEEKGSVLVKIDKWFPSSKTCHCCGEYNENVILGVSEWVCPHCGTIHDRDENAAINIEMQGIKTFLEYFRNWLEEDEKARKRAKNRQNGRKKKKAA